VYRNYLRYFQKTRQVRRLQVLNTRRVLFLFSQWVTRKGIKLEKFEIEHADRFQAEVSNRYGVKNREHHRSVLRELFCRLHQQKIIRRNLAPLLIAPPQYARAVPPKFLRPGELQKLFTRRPQAATEKRTWAMLHLACFLGLRPREISLIRLDDIDFSRQEIVLPERKAANPICMALPMVVIRAIAEYIIDIRPETAKRELFLRLRPPFMSVSGQLVGRNISQWMHRYFWNTYLETTYKKWRRPWITTDLRHQQIELKKSILLRLQRIISLHLIASVSPSPSFQPEIFSSLPVHTMW